MNKLGIAYDLWKARRGGLPEIEARQRKRLVEIVSFARAKSPFYRELYEGLPERIDDASQLPVTDKKKLMARFDEWCTDREVTLEKAKAFIEKPELAGKPFLGRYTAMTTSGTTGTPGIFVVDEHSIALAQTILGRTFLEWLGFGGLFRIILRGGRMALIAATGGHYAAHIAAVQRPKLIRELSVHMPMKDMVTKLNQIRPAILAPYSSIGVLLAGEKEAGRLHINPVLVVPTAEGLSLPEYERLARVFRAKVGYSYAASECMHMSASCRENWLHVNADWAILEAVDEEYRPVKPGEQSHTVLVTNLANRAQPILRYDLGDSIIIRPDPCPCGNPLPAIRVQGRSSQVLKLDGVSVPPLAIEIDVPGVLLSQIVQTAPSELALRLTLESSADREATWQMALNALTEALERQGLHDVKVVRDEKEPERLPGGKHRPIIPLDKEDS